MIENNIVTTESLLSIFIFTLIISGNFLAELFPCKIQHMLTNNIIIKHIFGFLTLFFFGSLTFPSLSKNIDGMIHTLILYVIFIITAKTPYKIWLSIFFIYTFLYILHIIVTDYESKISDNKNSKQILQYKYRINVLKQIQKLCIIIIPILTIVGLTIYMGEKKFEYGNKFNYWTFFTGKPVCVNKSPKISFTQSLKHAFT